MNKIDQVERLQAAVDATESLEGITIVWYDVQERNGGPGNMWITVAGFHTLGRSIRSLRGRRVRYGVPGRCEYRIQGRNQYGDVKWIITSDFV